jgi:alkylation response protein AidB-like acyl-CoA dehydrogenase
MSRTENRWVDQAQSISQRVLAQHAEDVDRLGRWPAESVASLAESRLLGLTVEASQGGAGEGPRTFAAVMCLLAEECASTAMIYLMHVCAAQVVGAAKAFPHREAVLRDITAGRHLSTLAFSEKGSRSHFWAPVSQAVSEGDTHRLSASKSFVTSAGHADGYIVSSRCPGTPDEKALNLYYVPGGAPGLNIGDPWNGMGLRGNASAPIYLEEVKVPISHRLGDEGQGFNFMIESVLPWFLLGSAAVSVGIGRAATKGISRHLLASKLEHLDQSLASLMNLRARLARMRIAVDSQQAFLDKIASSMESAGPDTFLGLLETKAAAAEAAVEVTDLAMRTGGGASFGRRLTVERNFRDARAASIMAPTTDILHDFIARTLLEMPLF